MPKLLTLFVFSLLIIISQPMPWVAAQTASQATGSNNRSANPNKHGSAEPLTIEPPQQAGAEQKTATNVAPKDKEQSVKLTEIPPVTIREKDKGWTELIFDWGPWVFNALMVAVTAVYVIITRKILLEMRQQRTDSIRTTNIAEQAANAASLNARALIASERPWLLIDVGIPKGEPAFNPRYVVQARNAGRTPAKLDSGHCSIKKHSATFIGPSSDIDDPFRLPNQTLIVTADSFPIRDLFPSKLVTEEEKQGIGSDPQALFVYGTLTYWDTFTDRNAKDAKPYETRWLFRFDNAEGKFVRCAGDYARNT